MTLIFYNIEIFYQRQGIDPATITNTETTTLATIKANNPIIDIRSNCATKPPSTKTVRN